MEKQKFAREYVITYKENQLNEKMVMPLRSSKDSVNFARLLYGDDLTIYESFYILLLDTSLKIFGYAKISQGGVSGTVSDPKLMAYYAVNSLASAVILVHNHPSGNLHPSNADKQLTQRVKNGFDLLNINVVDHIILSKYSYLSFADEGLL